MPQGQGTYSHPHLSEYTGNQNQNNMSFMTGAGGAALGMLGGFIGAGNQHRRQRELMSLQHQNQMALNRQGHQLQFDMWKKTSYPAQLKMMKEAGLSPGLMYGGGPGAGGSTGSQGGGSAAGGSAAAFNPMDLSNMMLMKAQAEDLKAGARLKNVEADKKSGIDTQEGLQRILESEENIKNLGVARREMESKIVLNEATADLQRIGIVKTGKEMDQIEAMIRKINVDTHMQRTILELDYGDGVGKNWMAEAKKVFGGEFDTSTYLGAAATIAGIAALRNPAVFTNLFKTTTKVKGFTRAKSGLKKLYNDAIDWFKWKFRKRGPGFQGPTN